jgi:pyruvate kinase
MLKRCFRRGVAVITATQMLESMITNPRPTRAETTDVFNAVADETDAVMLSGETAAGRYPVEAVKFMAAVAMEAEKLAIEDETWTRLLPEVARDIEEIVAHSACSSAVDIGAKAIVAYTNSGATARYISKYHPPVPVVAMTPNEKISRQLALSWGVWPIVVESYSHAVEMVEQAEATVKKIGLAKPGAIIVIVAGLPLGPNPSSNIMKLHKVGPDQ